MAEFVYCLNTSTIQPSPLLEKIRIAGEAGYKAIEPWNDEIDAHLARGGTLRELETAIADAGLKVASVIALHDWAATEGDAHLRALDECRRRMDQAAALESPYIVATPPQKAVDLERIALQFVELMALGEQAGVAPAMEFLGFVDGVNSVAGAWAIAQASRNARAAIVADVFHMIRGGGSVDDVLKVPGHRMANFHINDVPATPDPRTQTDHDRVMIGEGAADLPRLIANLRTIGYRGPLSLELFNKDLWRRDPLEVARRGLDLIRALVAA